MKNSKKLVLPIIAIGSMLLTGCNGKGATGPVHGVDPHPGIPAEYKGKKATGAFNFSEDTREEKTKKLAILEEYAITHCLTGIPLMDDSSKTEFSERIKLPTDKFITNFGFGITKAVIDPKGKMGNGKENKFKTYKNYLHDFSSVDSGYVNAWNSIDADVMGRANMIQAGFFDQILVDGEVKWVPALCKTVKPIMLEENEKGELVEVHDYDEEKTSYHWRLKVRVGKEENAVFRTSENSKYKEKYDGKGIKLEDYITPFKTMVDNDLLRSGDLYTGENGFQGVDAYKHSKDTSFENWQKLVGIKANAEEQSIDISFNNPQNVYDARYKLASGTLYGPMSQEFLDDIGGAKEFGILSKGAKDSFDNVLCTGLFIPESFEQNKQFVLKRNDKYHSNYVETYKENGDVDTITNELKADTKDWGTSLEGWVESIITSKTEAFKKYLNGELDTCEIPSEYMIEHKNDPNAITVPGSSVAALNVNTCNQGEWEYYFGEDGTIAKHDKKHFHNIKPIMSNEDFIRGVYFSIPRKDIADYNGRRPFATYLSDAYTLDPMGKVMYRNTAEGKKVEERVTGGAEYGYSKDFAKTLFKRAIDKSVAEGSLIEGERIELDAYFMRQASVDNYGNQIKRSIESLFNEEAKEFDIKLTFNTNIVTSPMDIYTEHMDQGLYDFGEGGISGAAFNPLGFMRNGSSTRSIANGFTMNWGEITDRVDGKRPLMYDGVAWSYDAFWQATTSKAIVIDGHLVDFAKDERIKLINEINEAKANRIGMEFVIPSLHKKDEDGNDAYAIDYNVKGVELYFNDFENAIPVDFAKLEKEGKAGIDIDSTKLKGYVWIDLDTYKDLIKFDDNKEYTNKDVIAMVVQVSSQFEFEGKTEINYDTMQDVQSLESVGLIKTK